MLDDIAKDFHATRKSLTHEWQRMEGGRTNYFDCDRPATNAMLIVLKGDAQHAAISKFIEHQIDEAQAKVILIYQEGFR